MSERMEEGKYYVGDLCYVFNDKQWQEVCKLTFPYPKSGPNRNKQVDGKFTLKDGTVFCIFGTAYGDGVYTDNKDNEYYVDSGTLGCVRTTFLDKTLLRKSPEKGSHLHDADFSFECEERDGVIRFGSVVIDTSGEGD